MYELSTPQLVAVIDEYVAKSADFRATHAGYRIEDVTKAARTSLAVLMALGYVKGHQAIATSPENAYRGHWLAEVDAGSLGAVLDAQSTSLEAVEQALSEMYPDQPAHHHGITSEVGYAVASLVVETNSFVRDTDDQFACWGGLGYDEDDERGY
jgi:hypothetical protein